MMKLDSGNFKKYLAPFLCAVVGVLFLGAAVMVRYALKNTDKVAEGTSSLLESRLKEVETLMDQAMAPDTTGWLQLRHVPEDVVIYRYMYDTLQSWKNQFIIMNDAIQVPLFIMQRMSRPEYGITAPLSTIGEEWGAVNLGPKWYVAKRKGDGICDVIAALEVCSVGAEGEITDINKTLHVPSSYTLRPLAGNVGTEISAYEKPQFQLVDSAQDNTHLFENSSLRWIGLAFLVLALLLLLYKKRSLSIYIFTSVSFLVFFFLARYWGGQMVETSNIFSPSVYAGGAVWSSFGDLMMLDLLILLECFSLFLMKDLMLDWAKHRNTKLRMSAIAALLILLVVALVAYSICSACSLIRNSSISFELQWFKEGLLYTLMAIVAYALMFGVGMRLLQFLMEPLHELAGHSPRILTPANTAIAAVVVAFALFGVSAGLGFDKEHQKVQVWANRLSVDRDLGLELHLRSIELALQTDEVVAMLSTLDGANNILASRIEENYLLRYANDYDIAVSTCAHNDWECMQLFSKKLSGGTPIADPTNFVCIYHNNGRSSYAGLFSYVTNDGSLTRMLIEITSKAAREDNGYYSIFKELGRPGNVSLPEEYSYGKYVSGKLVSYKGTFAYPTILTDRYKKQVGDRSSFRYDGYIHFLNEVGDDELIVISRPRRTILQLISSLLSILAIVALIMIPSSVTRSRRNDGVRNTFRRRINIVLTGAIFVSLVTLASVSIKFVFDRNRADTNDMMSSKISTVQTMVESLVQDAPDYSALMSQEFRNNLLSVASNTRSDVTLYTPNGRVFISTVSDVFDDNLLSTRISDEAYNQVVNEHQRLYMSKEQFDGVEYYALYAPVFNREDQMVAIVSTPYSSGTSLMKEAVPHAILMFIIVLALLAIFAILATGVVNAVFSPLIEVSRKMEAAAVNGLETIDYPHDDEISGLIESYNRMVHDLEISTQKMAQNERDMAWSEMARQVAHEIKNPLTPMKLAIQRLIRLKQKNDPNWATKFDDLSNVILEQIDTLTETANDFSTFAKLYTEDPVEVDLGKMLQEQLLIFDNKENITITYIGMPDAVIMAPRPQLIRVVVNLITNSIQAIEISQKESEERGEEVAHGMINVLLRNSTQDGFYDIVVEDNGPGVAEENQDKIFTPKFTTKSSGSGLGLAISRSIIEKCGGEISYFRSITLGGASFQLRLPKMDGKL